MMPTPGDLVRLHFESLDALDVIQMMMALLLLASIVTGVIALIRAHRQRRTGLAMRTLPSVHRMVGAATALGLLICILAVAGMAYHQWTTHMDIVSKGANVTPADLSVPVMDAFLGLAFGLMTGATGLALGWALEWFADGLENSAREPEIS